MCVCSVLLGTRCCVLGSSVFLSCVSPLVSSYYLFEGQIFLVPQVHGEGNEPPGVCLFFVLCVSVCFIMYVVFVVLFLTVVASL